MQLPFGTPLGDPLADPYFCSPPETEVLSSISPVSGTFETGFRLGERAGARPTGRRWAGGRRATGGQAGRHVGRQWADGRASARAGGRWRAGGRRATGEQAGRRRVSSGRVVVGPGGWVGGRRANPLIT